GPREATAQVWPEDIAARHRRRAGLGGRRSRLAARHGYMHGSPADDDRLDAAFPNSLLEFTQNRAEDVSLGGGPLARVGRSGRGLTGRERNFLAGIGRRTG